MRDSLALVPLGPSGVVHAISTPFQTDSVSATSTTTNPLAYSEIGSSTAAPLTAYTGRYTQPDPLNLGTMQLPQPGVDFWDQLDSFTQTLRQPQWQQAFSYALNSPLSATDPDGRIVRGPFFNTGCGERMAGVALAAARQLSSRPEDLHNGFADAYRHCVWNCLMVRNCGGPTALLVATGYELRFPWNPPAEQNMDLHNNAEGARVRRCLL